MHFRAQAPLLLPTFTFALGASACLFAPTEGGTELCGADGTLEFRGYSPISGDVITFEASDSATGPFTVIGTTTADTTPLSISSTGENFYSFSASFPAELWTSSPYGLSTYIKSRSGTFDLLTFEASNAAGQTAYACILTEVTGGLTYSQAALECDRGDDVVEVEAPLVSTCGCTPFAEPGDLVIDDARSAALAQCVTSVGGALRILDTAPDVVQLDSLTSIGGEAELHYELPPPSGVGATRNRTIDLSALLSIGGDVAMSTYRGPTDPKTIDTMTGSVTSIGGDVTISTYDNNVSAFGAVTALAGSVTLEGWTGPSGNLDIFGTSTFPNLTSVGGDLTVQGFYACNQVFNAVTDVSGRVTVRAVRLAPQQSFQDLETVGGDLRFWEMKSIGPSWPSLISVGGELQGRDNTTLSALSQLPVGAAAVGGLRLQDNANLVTLDGTMQAGTGDITISGSPSLSQCDVDTFLADQAAGGWTGTDSISDTVACP